MRPSRGQRTAARAYRAERARRPHGETPGDHTATRPASAPGDHTATRPASAPGDHTATRPASAPGEDLTVARRPASAGTEASGGDNAKAA